MAPVLRHPQPFLAPKPLDLLVIDDPSLMAKGEDPQLDRAVQELLKELRKSPPIVTKKPKYPLRAGR